MGWAIERKGSIDELVTCCSIERDRFERELMRMRAQCFQKTGCDWFQSGDRVTTLPFTDGAKGRSSHTRSI
jgi:hypothetical protein